MSDAAALLFFWFCFVGAAAGFLVELERVLGRGGRR